MLEVPELQNAEQVRSYEALADLLASAVPASSRTEARELLTSQLLPNLIGDLADPRVPPKAAYQQIGSLLSKTPPEERLAALRRAAAHAEMREQSMSAVSLAIARYAKEHPAARAQAEAWADPAMPAFQAMSIEQISQEAARRLAQLSRWQQRARQNPELWEPDRVSYLQTELSLQSARTGNYGTAAGGLYDFLGSVGATVDELDEH
jgi:hypothetical protein